MKKVIKDISPDADGLLKLWLGTVGLPKGRPTLLEQFRLLADEMLKTTESQIKNDPQG